MSGLTGSGFVPTVASERLVSCVTLLQEGTLWLISISWQVLWGSSRAANCSGCSAKGCNGWTEC